LLKGTWGRYSRRQDRLKPVLLLGTWVLLGLVGHEPWKPDEAYTFGLVYHVLETGEWLVPTLGGLPFVEKPPIFFWTAAVFAKIFGGVLPLHDAARLAAGFYVALTLGFTYLLSERRIAAPLILAGCLGYLQHAHQLITDNSLMAGVAMGLYGLKTNRGLWLGTGAGIAFLSKGLVGPGLLGVSAIALITLPAWRHTWRSWPWAVLAFLPWALIWPWLLYRHSPALFHEWFVVNNFGRFSGSAGLGGVLDHFHYVEALPWFGAPAWVLAAWTLWRSRRALVPELQLPLVSFVAMLAVLSASSSARTLYGLPFLVPLALLAVPAADAMPRWVDRAVAVVFALAGAAAWLSWLFLPERSALAPKPGPVAIGAAIAVTALWIWSLGFRPALPARWLAGVTLLWGLAMTLYLPLLDWQKSYREVAASMQEARRNNPDCVAARDLTEPQRGMFHYYAGIREPAPKDCGLLLVHTPSARQPTPGEGWKLVWRGTRPGDEKEFFWLFEK
jgi:4-amino-4-deoxy-L-arabinose transferase-like glycosyltransferase